MESKAIKLEGNRDRIDLVLAPSPLPTIADDEILIQVKSAGINRADILQKQGKYLPPTNSPAILGLEVSGIVSKMGKKVNNFKIGDNIAALLEGGGYATFAKCKSSQAFKIPKNLNFNEAASLPESLFTACYNLFEIAKISKEKDILIHSGASGIGVYCIQIAKIFANMVISTASNETKCKFIKNIGADHAINYTTQNLQDEIAKITNNKGVDIILDTTGASNLQTNINSLKYKGHLLLLAMLGGYKTELNIIPIINKNLNIHGTTIRDKSPEVKSKLCCFITKEILPFIEDGSIKPIIYDTLPLENADKAHKIMENNENIGKIILQCSK